MKIHRVFGTAHTSRFNASTTSLSNIYEVDVPLGPSIVRWNMKTKNKVSIFTAHSDVITFMKRSTNRDIIATASNGGEIKLWDNEWNHLSTVEVGEERLTNAEWSKDGKQIIVVCEEKGLIYVVNVSNLNGNYRLYIADSYQDNFEFASITYQGNIIAVKQKTSKKNQGSKILLLSKELKPLKELQIFDDDVISFYSIDYTHSKIIFSNFTEPRNVKILNCEDLTVEQNIQIKGKGLIRSMMIEKDRLIFPGNNGIIYYYSIDGKFIKEENVPSGTFFLMEWAQKDEAIWLANEGSLFYYKIGSKNGESCNKEITYHNLTCCGLDFSSDGKYLACGDFLGNIYIWDIENHKELMKTNVMASIRSLSWKKDSNDIYIGCMNGSIFHWNIKSEEIKEILQLKGSITCLEWENGPKSQNLAIGTTKGFLTIFNETLNKILYQFLAHPPVKDHERKDSFGSIDLFSEIWSLKWSPNNKMIVTSSEDQTSKVWDLSGNLLAELKGHSTAVTGVDWNHTEIGEIIVTCADDKKLMVWNVDGFKLLYEFYSDVVEWHTLTYICLESKGSKTVTVTQNGYVLIWCLKERKLIFKKKLHNGSIEGLKWNFEKNLIGSCSSDCTINVYKMK